MKLNCKHAVSYDKAGQPYLGAARLLIRSIRYIGKLKIIKDETYAVVHDYCGEIWIAKRQDETTWQTTNLVAMP